MRYRRFSRSGLRVSEFCLGTMTFGEEWQFGASKEGSKAIFDEFCESGGNFIDTANSYTYGTSERLVGEFIKSEREYFIVSTKYTLTVRPRDPNGGGNHRRNMVYSLERSLKQIGVDHIDIFWVHVWDYGTRVDEVMRGLDDLVRGGKILHIGISYTPAWIVSQADTLAELRGWTQFVGIQVEYNLLERTSEIELIPMACALDLAVLAWAPLGGGVLSGKYVRKGDRVYIEDSKRGQWLNSNRLTSRTLDIASCVDLIATEIGCTSAQVALAWLRARHGVIPIVGARTIDQIRENLGSVNVVLSGAQLEQLETISEIKHGYPHEFNSSEPLRQALLGDKRDCFDA